MYMYAYIYILYVHNVNVTRSLRLRCVLCLGLYDFDPMFLLKLSFPTAAWPPCPGQIYPLLLLPTMEEYYIHILQQLPGATHFALSGQGARPHLLHLRRVPAQQRWLGGGIFLHVPCLLPHFFLAASASTPAS